MIYSHILSHEYVSEEAGTVCIPLGYSEMCEAELELCTGAAVSHPAVALLALQTVLAYEAACAALKVRLAQNSWRAKTLHVTEHG